jgi:hypothetical protein
MKRAHSARHQRLAQIFGKTNYFGVDNSFEAAFYRSCLPSDAKSLQDDNTVGWAAGCVLQLHLTSVMPILLPTDGRSGYDSQPNLKWIYIRQVRSCASLRSQRPRDHNKVVTDLRRLKVVATCQLAKKSFSPDERILSAKERFRAMKLLSGISMSGIIAHSIRRVTNCGELNISGDQGGAVHPAPHTPHMVHRHTGYSH